MGVPSVSYFCFLRCQCNNNNNKNDWFISCRWKGKYIGNAGTTNHSDCHYSKLTSEYLENVFYLYPSSQHLHTKLFIANIVSNIKTFLWNTFNKAIYVCRNHLGHSSWQSRCCVLLEFACLIMTGILWSSVLGLHGEPIIQVQSHLLNFSVCDPRSPTFLFTKKFEAIFECLLFSKYSVGNNAECKAIFEVYFINLIKVTFLVKFVWAVKDGLPHAQ